MRASRGSERGGAARQYLAAQHHSPIITPSDMTPIIGNCACFPGKYDSRRHGHIRAFEIVWSCRATNAALAHQTSAGNPPPIRASALGPHPRGRPSSTSSISSQPPHDPCYIAKRVRTLRRPGSPITPAPTAASAVDLHAFALDPGITGKVAEPSNSTVPHQDAHHRMTIPAITMNRPTLRCSPAAGR